MKLLIYHLKQAFKEGVRTFKTLRERETIKEKIPLLVSVNNDRFFRISITLSQLEDWIISAYRKEEDRRIPFKVLNIKFRTGEKQELEKSIQEAVRVSLGL